jgi:3-oxoadipate enol-lactonase
MQTSAQARGIRFNLFDSGGDRPVILLVHGFALDHRMWEPQLDVLASEWRVIAPDLRGFGLSDGGPSGPLTMVQHADDLVAILDALGIPEPVVYVGLSMGGYAAFEMVRRHPEKLRALLLVDTKATSDGPQQLQYRSDMASKADALNSPAPALDLMWPRLCSPSLSLDSAVPQRLREIMESVSGRAIADGQRGMALRSDSVDLLSEIMIPTLVVVGEDDVLTPREESRLMVERLPDASLLEIPGAGHMSNMEAPHVFNAAMLEWVNSLSKN